VNKIIFLENYFLFNCKVNKITYCIPSKTVKKSLLSKFSYIFAMQFNKQKMMKPLVRKYIIIITIVLLVLFAGFVFIRYYYVFGEGVKTGQLNYVVYKGYLFKTYEGKIIQSGFRSQNAGSIQSYEFAFSVEDKALADSLMLCGGKEVELHYKEYIGVLPWRGVSKYIVDGIIAVGK